MILMVAILSIPNLGILMNPGLILYTCSIYWEELSMRWGKRWNRSTLSNPTPYDLAYTVAPCYKSFLNISSGGLFNMPRLFNRPMIIVKAAIIKNRVAAGKMLI